MRRKIVAIAALIIVLIAGAFALGGILSNPSRTEYQFATLTRGNLENIISATGLLSPLTTVDIGTQVSGSIDTVYIDFNDNVREGQILAVLDTILLKTSVVDAQASLERAAAALEQAQADYERNQQLYERNMISESAFLPFKISLKTQAAAVKSAEAALLRAQRNLEYAVIRSPINGIVISKNIEGGQTVAASFSTPTLFQIAEDLAHMQILVDVDESDIGSIQEGQPVRFQVQAFSDREFTGVVRQVRMQPNTISNVVTYTVVVDAENKDNLLLPGMTATVEFIVEAKSDVLLVSNKALRFQPSDDELQKIMAESRRQFENMPDSLKRARQQSADSTELSAGGIRQKSKDLGQIWYLDNSGQLMMEPVRIGMSDGTYTEIVASRSLKENMQVISGSETSETTTRNNRNNGSGGFGPPPGF